MIGALWRRSFVWQWRGWRRALRDFALVQLGFFIFGISINLVVNANLGTAPWLALDAAIARLLGLTLGRTIILTSVLVIIADLALGQALGWGTLANMLCIGLWTDGLQPLVPLPPPALWAQLAYVLVSVALLGLGTALYVGVHAGAGPRDSLMLAVARRLRVGVQSARLGIDVAVVVLALLLGGSVGIGTLIVALTTGPAIQLCFRLLRVTPQPPAPAPNPEG